MKKIIITLTLFICMNSYSQQDSKSNYWQQHVDYTMDIDVDVTNFQYKGTQQLVYTNNSPDQLTRVFYHLYFNAFQPNSQMDVRSRNIQDPDRRVRDRISKLKPEEIGFIKVNSLTQDGKKAAIEIIAKHRLIELYLVNKMQFDLDEVHEIAEEIEHIKNTKFFIRMQEILGDVKLDPHGSVIPKCDF